ncbi:hypothetical protein CROQUDRAFT_89939 [Cronartium quercuum f. sp. fusiforme G11]|uniref:Retrovirus-related Pol polyprotein from transposon TNT 1-94-like beta-barrel domain-containing protein n=1 Tax=Cronartium quercuum f. sp. fusiforme G11 TaxID=708437 RepID=A0A9P6TEB3_9BASI|nr:hypothetical protein CROQUDRAFT_89939 [Cronartium quercuum f. sp. fusiforme G11]
MNGIRKCLELAMVNTGSSHYMFNDKKLFVEGSLIENTDPSAFLRLAGGNATLPIRGFGQFIQVNPQGEHIVFNDVLYIPELTHNLLAGGRDVCGRK